MVHCQEGHARNNPVLSDESTTINCLLAHELPYTREAPVYVLFPVRTVWTSDGGSEEEGGGGEEELRLHQGGLEPQVHKCPPQLAAAGFPTADASQSCYKLKSNE